MKTRTRRVPRRMERRRRAAAQVPSAGGGSGMRWMSCLERWAGARERGWGQSAACCTRRPARHVWSGQPTPPACAMLLLCLQGGSSEEEEEEGGSEEDEEAAAARHRAMLEAVTTGGGAAAERRKRRARDAVVTEAYPEAAYNLPPSSEQRLDPSLRWLPLHAPPARAASVSAVVGRRPPPAQAHTTGELFPPRRRTAAGCGRGQMPPQSHPAAIQAAADPPTDAAVYSGRDMHPLHLMHTRPHAAAPAAAPAAVAAAWARVGSLHQLPPCCLHPRPCARSRRRRADRLRPHRRAGRRQGQARCGTQSAGATGEEGGAGGGAAAGAHPAAPGAQGRVGGPRAAAPAALLAAFCGGSGALLPCCSCIGPVCCAAVLSFIAARLYCRYHCTAGTRRARWRPTSGCRS